MAEHYNQLFAPLAGSDVAVDTSKEVLAGYINNYLPDHPDGFFATNPYDRLSSGVFSVFNNAVLGVRELSEREVKRVSDAGWFGLELAIAVVEGVGDGYNDAAVAPQRASMVKQNAARALLGLYPIAFQGAGSAIDNILSLQAGRAAPNSLSQGVRLARFEAARRWGNKRIQMGKNSFEITEDPQEQLRIRPRFRAKADPDSHRKCPATAAYVGPPGNRRSALLSFMNVIADSAIEEIYPHYITITAEEEPATDSIAA